MYMATKCATILLISLCSFGPRPYFAFLCESLRFLASVISFTYLINLETVSLFSLAASRRTRTRSLW
ncbi:hypothetical protein B0H16DRAFT_693744 [Mycena metata]|uniref:Uncharacterized protein n=1 Tax=Mycena metata TaxID=1033252 RepID=A0AAD7J3T3_9AGAR|nr:hypothetical protein B0H16DRAFT_693744 [Mycena metata]